MKGRWSGAPLRALGGLTVALLVVGCASGGDDGTVEPTSEETGSAATKPPSEAAPSEAATTPEAKVLGSAELSTPFTLGAADDAGLSKVGRFLDQVVYFRAGVNSWLIVTDRGPETLDGWEDLLGDGGASVGDRVSVDVAGTSTEMLTAVAGAPVTLLDLSGEGQTDGFGLDADDGVRIGTVDVDGEILSVIVVADGDDLDAWTATLAPVLGGLTWGSAP